LPDEDKELEDREKEIEADEEQIRQLMAAEKAAREVLRADRDHSIR